MSVKCEINFEILYYIKMNVKCKINFLFIFLNKDGSVVSVVSAVAYINTYKFT